MKLRCAIVDDEPLALSLLESYVNKTPFLELAGKYSSAVQAMKELPGNQIDLLFLDIQMPELNGLEFSKWYPLVPVLCSLLLSVNMPSTDTGSTHSTTYSNPSRMLTSCRQPTRRCNGSNWSRSPKK